MSKKREKGKNNKKREQTLSGKEEKEKLRSRIRRRLSAN